MGAKSSYDKATVSFNFLVNMTCNTKNIFGIGSGVEYLGQPFTPLFLEDKYLFSDRKTTPFIFLRGGKLLHLKGDELNTDYIYPQYNTHKSYKGGGSFTLGTGISWAKDESETYLSFAYRYAHTSYSQKEYNQGIVTYNNSLKRLEIKFGFKF